MGYRVLETQRSDRRCRKWDAHETCVRRKSRRHGDKSEDADKCDSGDQFPQDHNAAERYVWKTCEHADTRDVEHVRLTYSRGICDKLSTGCEDAVGCGPFETRTRWVLRRGRELTCNPAFHPTRYLAVGSVDYGRLARRSEADRQRRSTREKSQGHHQTVVLN
jgi:hypothetical protein